MFDLINKVSLIESEDLYNLILSNEIEKYDNYYNCGDLIVTAITNSNNIKEAIEIEFGSVSVKKYLEELNVKLVYDENAIDEFYPLFACFKAPDIIQINRKIIENTKQLIIDFELSSIINIEEIEDILIAHELFHYLVDKQKNSFFDEKHLYVKSFIFKKGYRLGELEEIAAMNFAKELLKLNYNPYLLNIIMMYTYDKEKALKMAKKYLKET
jgi:hypothetical protein